VKNMSEFYEEQDTGGGTFLMGLLAGTLLGAGLGLLLAPKTGSDLRRQLRTRAGEWADTAEQTYRRASDTVGDLADRGRDLAERGREFGREMYERTSGAGQAAEEKQM
jgi:gas vesicle protein